MNISKAKRLKLARLLALVQQIQTTEGETLYIEGELAVDVEVFVADGDGNMVPAPDGTYTTENKTITVTSGKVSEIKEVEQKPIDNPEALEEPEPEGDPDPTDTDNPDELKARIAELEAEVSKKDARIAELEAENDELKAKLEEPAAEPIEDEEKNKFNKEGEPNLTARILNASYGKKKKNN